MNSLHLQSVTICGFISDEVYDRIVFDSEHVSFVGTDYDKVMLINSFSKTFAMTGWRIGYIMSANLEAMKQVIKMQYYITACSNDAMQYAVLEAMEKASDYPDVLAKEFHARCNLIVDRLNAMPGVECHRPKGSIYVFPKIQVPGLNSQELAMELLKDGVLCSPEQLLAHLEKDISALHSPFLKRIFLEAWTRLRLR